MLYTFYCRELVRIINATAEELKSFGTDYGVKINEALTPAMKKYGVEGIIITEVDEQKVETVADVKKILQNKAEKEDTLISFLDRNGQKTHFVFN